MSVIVRSMDRPTLDEALASVARQSWQPIEVVVVNAKGAPHRELGTACGPHELRLVDPGRPLGRSEAANEGLQAARGQWCCFLDDDDWLLPEHVEALARMLQSDPSLVAAYSGVSCVAPDEAGEWREAMRYDFAWDRARLVCENFIPIHAVLFSREAALATAGFDTSLPIFEDWDFWLQLSRVGAFAHLEGHASAVYRLGSGDSGLLGNEALQEEMAARVMAKWLPALDSEEIANLWRLGRMALRAAAREEAAHRAAIANLEAAHDATLVNLDAAQRELAEKSRHIELLQAEHARVAAESTKAQQRLSASLQSALREHEIAVALLRQEQMTVLRPIARHLKRALRPLYSRLPQPVQRAARRMLARPAAAPAFPVAEAAKPDPVAAMRWRDALAGGRSGAATIIVFPVIDWHFRIQRPQHLAREMALRGHRVIYLSTTFAHGSGLAGCRLLGSPHPDVHLVQLALPGTPPRIYEDTLTPEQAVVLAESLVDLQREAGLGAFVSLVNLPFWRPVADALPANLMVYDCMDWHAGFSTNTGRMLDEEHRLLHDCDLLLTSSARLAELMQEKAPSKPHALVRNGAEVAHFAQVPPALAFEPDGRPVAGYFGAISEWFDMGLVIAAARARPQWRFVLVGSTEGARLADAKRVPNIEFVGEVPYAELPGWVHGFDVCMIPFVLNELTSCTNPVKVYEYLSAGKPVVATRMPELEAIADQVLLASDADDFVRRLDEAMANGRSAEQADARREWAHRHSWQARADLLEHAIEDTMPKISVVVLCYNNLALTQACLASLERHSHWPKLETVIVDNASTDATPEWLRDYASSRPWVKLVLNERNLGFAAGNNVGLAAATGDILVMLNNDTQVSPGWLHGLWRHLAHDPALGMVGPVTNNIGNEAKIDVPYTDPADMPAWAAARAVRFAGRQTASRVLAFFCVALRREVYARVGGLDEAFGLGFFEDDDYCNRVREAGWQMAIADDVFVHHHLSASFDKLKSSARQALFEKNRALYESKWGPWVPHRYRDAKPGLQE